jgi:hypothetical protein
MRKLAAGAAMAVFLFVVRFGWNLINADAMPEEPSAKEAAAEVDGWVAEDLGSGAAAPARDWLAQKDNALFEGDPETVQALIDELYSLGAPNVWFTGIDQFGGANISASIAVELSEDASVRQAILRKQAEFWEQPEPEPDVGQRYIMISFD